MKPTREQVLDLITRARIMMEEGPSTSSAMSVMLKYLAELAFSAGAAAEAEKWASGVKISIPTETMEQEFSNFHRLGFQAGAAAEREACALLCDELDNEENDGFYRSGARWCAERIRARGRA